MKIKNEFPPNIEKIKKYFKLPRNVIFTYGDTIYNPDGAIIDVPLMKHEAVHIKQQGDNPESWWDRYCVDGKFRLEKEIEAYQVQYKTAKNIFKDREVLNRYLISMATDLSSKIYGNIISYQDAIKVIKNI